MFFRGRTTVVMMRLQQTVSAWDRSLSRRVMPDRHIHAAQASGGERATQLGRKLAV
jgi:hypothetical protein